MDSLPLRRGTDAERGKASRHKQASLASIDYVTCCYAYKPRTSGPLTA